MAESTGRLLVYHINTCPLILRLNSSLPAYTNRPKCSKDTNGSEVGATSSDHAKNRRDTYSRIESEAAAKDIAAETPEDCTEKKTDVLSECEELCDISSSDNMKRIM